MLYLHLQGFHVLGAACSPLHASYSSLDKSSHNQRLPALRLYARASNTGFSTVGCLRDSPVYILTTAAAAAEPGTLPFRTPPDLTRPIAVSLMGSC